MTIAQNVSSELVQEAIDSLKADFQMIAAGHEFDGDAVEASMAMLRTISSFFTADKLGLTDTYSVLALNTNNLPEVEEKALSTATSSMLMKRDTGFLLKLDEELDDSLEDWKDFPHLLAIIKYAHDLGFRMIELDGSAPKLESFPVFDW